jgi:uncharacterized protein (DUF1499 family)
MISVLSAQFLLSFGMFVLLLMVQFVVYPQFLNVPQSSLAAYAIKYSQLITVVVAPLMIAELITILWCLKFGELRSIPLFAAIVCLVAIWLHTFLVEVPLHNQIQQFSSYQDVAALIQANKVRAILWGVKTVILAVFLGIIVAPYFLSRDITVDYIAQPFKKPNGVSTLVSGSSVRIEPITLAYSMIMPEIERRFSANTSHFMVISRGANALRFVVRTPGMKFPDVVTVIKKENVLHFRSQAMFGYSDLNMNRTRMEFLRGVFASNV